jgi:hypothetical protein
MEKETTWEFGGPYALHTSSSDKHYGSSRDN